MSDVLTAVVPSLGMLVLFAVVVRAIVHADRRERSAAGRYGSDASGAPLPAPGDGGESAGESTPEAGSQPG